MIAAFEATKRFRMRARRAKILKSATVQIALVLTSVSVLADQSGSRPKTPEEACQFASAPLRKARASKAETLSDDIKANEEQEALAKKYLPVMRQQRWASEQEFYVGKLAFLAQ